MFEDDELEEARVEQASSWPMCWRDLLPRERWLWLPGKLQLLYEVERVAALLRDGDAPFDPARDRAAFARHLTAIGCQPPPLMEKAAA